MKMFTLRRPTTISSSNDVEAEFISVQTVTVKTIPTKPKREININNIKSIDDLQSIKRQDPFMYYSIPGVRSAKILMKDDSDIDTSNLGVSSLKSMRNCTSCPSRIPTSNTKTKRRTVRQQGSTKNDDWDQQEEQASPPSQKIERSTCISFECYPDLLLDDDLFDDDEDDLGDVDILALLTGQ